MKIKSTFNISFQIHFVCFVLKKKFSLFLEFYWLLPSICLLHDAAFLQKGRLMKLCDGDCTIKKTNRQ